jgi:plastocyanin domain-containing protein
MSMKENLKSKITVYLFLIVIGIILFLFYKGVSTKSSENKIEQTEVLGESKQVEAEGVQYLDITAKGGYAPAVIKAKAGMETILRIKTSSTFDCSSAFSIPKLNIRKNLPPTGSTEIALGVQTVGTKLLGTCSMGMYSFNMIFN